MAFPEEPRAIAVELYVNSTWTDVTGDVRSQNGIRISRGRSAESSSSSPATCDMVLDNRSGNYSPRNPVSLYYGSLKRNTPVRVALRKAKDTFSRSVVNGWGGTDTGELWTPISLGTFNAADFFVDSGVGSHSMSARNIARFCYLSAVSLRDVDVAVTGFLPTTNVLGGNLEPAGILLRGQTTSDYCHVRVSVMATESVEVAIRYPIDNTVAVSVVVPGLTYTASGLRVRAQAEGHTIRAKVWNPSGPEPFGWHIVHHDEKITTAGWVGIRSGVASANTNTLPVVLTCDDFEVRIPRFAGEVASWPQQQDRTSRDLTAEIEAAGINRRLSQGSPAVTSALRHGFLSRRANDLVAYWPCEDGAGAEEIASGLGGEPMLVQVFQPGEYTKLDASAPLPLTSLDGGWLGRVSPYSVVSGNQLRFVLGLGTTGLPDSSVMVSASATGSLSKWDILYHTGGAISVKALRRDGSTAYGSGPIAFAVTDVPRQWSLELLQVGGSVQAKIVSLEPGQTLGSLFDMGSIVGTVGYLSHVLANPYQNLEDYMVGHIAVQDRITSIFDLSSELNAWNGERAISRVERLCVENGVGVSYVGAKNDSAEMGLQRQATLLQLLTACEEADGGLLYEPKGELGISIRGRTSLYNQTPTLDLSYSVGELAQPFNQVDDDKLTVNDVTVKRQSGGERHLTLDVGPMSTLSPDKGGVGRYDTSVTVNVKSDVQLDDVAGWTLHLGTSNESRYPSISVDLANPTVVAAALEGAVLDVDIGDRITVSNPRTGLSYDQISQLVIGYVEDIGTFEHKLTFHCFPEKPYQVMTLDDTVGSRLDSESSTLAAAVASSATVLSVSTIVGDPLWTISSAEFPFDIEVDGEVMTVTNITGVASPQTFTVTRSVNGVVKAHVVGAEVHLARPTILAW